jgi:hypothetical protein
MLCKALGRDDNYLAGRLIRTRCRNGDKNNVRQSSNTRSRSSDFFSCSLRDGPRAPNALSRTDGDAGMTRTIIVLIGTFALLGAVNATAEPLWLSDTPPNAQWAKRTRHAHGGPVETGRRGIYVKRLWAKVGADPASAAYAQWPDEGELRIFGPGGAKVRPKVFAAGEGGGFTFSMPKEGFYDAYLVQRRVDGDVLTAAITKAEVLKHSCANGHDRRTTVALMSPRTSNAVPFELVRERLHNEDFHTHIASGDRLGFRVYRDGEPAAGATVRLTTEKGWSKSAVSDADGRVSFQLIADYFPGWKHFDEDRRERFVAQASYTASAQGSYQGHAYRTVRYVTTLPGSYYPARTAYLSYLYGLLVVLFAAALSVAGVFLYRLKRTRAVRERYDEKA